MQGTKCYNVGDGCGVCKALSVTMCYNVGDGCDVCKALSVTMLVMAVMCARH